MLKKMNFYGSCCLCFIVFFIASGGKAHCDDVLCDELQTDYLNCQTALCRVIEVCGLSVSCYDGFIDYAPNCEDINKQLVANGCNSPEMKKVSVGIGMTILSTVAKLAANLQGVRTPEIVIKEQKLLRIANRILESAQIL